MKQQTKKIFFFFGMGLLGLIVVFLVVRVLLNLGGIAATLGNILGALSPFFDKIKT